MSWNFFVDKAGLKPRDPHASASRVLALKTSANTPGSRSVLSTTSYFILSAGGKRPRSAELCVRQCRQRDRAAPPTATQGLITTAQREESGLQKLQPWLLRGTGLSPRPALTTRLLDKDTDLRSRLSFHRDRWGSLGSVWLPTLMLFLCVM